MRFLSLEPLVFPCISKRISSKKLIICFASGECVLLKTKSVVYERIPPFNIKTTPVSLRSILSSYNVTFSQFII